jgi:hypothetical protein
LQEDSKGKGQKAFSRSRGSGTDINACHAFSLNYLFTASGNNSAAISRSLYFWIFLLPVMG